MATLIKTGFPSFDAFIFEFNSESEARGTFACDGKSVLQILQKWHCDRAIVRVPNQPDIEIPIATLRLMAEFEPIVQLFFADTSPEISGSAGSPASSDMGGKHTRADLSACNLPGFLPFSV